MTDEELVAAFESTELQDFPHAAHVRVAWWYLRRYPYPEALDRFTIALKRFAASKGVPDKYDEGITVAYMSLIAARLEAARELSWEAFIAANADLLTRRAGAVSN